MISSSRCGCSGPGSRLLSRSASAVSAAWRAVRAKPAGSISSPRLTAAASDPASPATHVASSSSGARRGVNRSDGQDAASGADARPALCICGNAPARSRDDLPAPDAPDTTMSPILAEMLGHPCQDLRGSSLPAKEKPLVSLLECAEPTVRRINYPGVIGQRRRPKSVCHCALIDDDELKIVIANLQALSKATIDAVFGAVILLRRSRRSTSIWISVHQAPCRGLQLGLTASLIGATDDAVVDIHDFCLM